MGVAHNLASIQSPVLFGVLWAVAVACSPMSRPHVPVTPRLRENCLLPSSLAIESPAVALSAGEISTLLSGKRVEVASQFEYCGGQYVGGVGYVLVKATPEQVFTSLNQVSNLSQVIRGTRRMTVMRVDSAGAHVLMEQGNSVVAAKYTAVFQVTDGSDIHENWQVRFWLDEKKPHAIDDVWGVIRARKFDNSRSLVMAGTALNLGPGLIRMLFEKRVQGSILRMTRYVREVVEREYPAPSTRP